MQILQSRQATAFGSLCIAILATATLLQACKKNKAPESNESKSTPHEQVDRSSASESNASKKPKQRYDIRLIGTPVSAGEASNLTLEIRPGSGLKINDIYPFELELADESDGLTVPEKTFGPDAFDLTKKRARVNIPLTVQKPGMRTLSATADLSVCNDSHCFRMSDEKLTLQFKVRSNKGTHK